MATDMALHYLHLQREAMQRAQQSQWEVMSGMAATSGLGGFGRQLTGGVGISIRNEPETFREELQQETNEWLR